MTTITLREKKPHSVNTHLIITVLQIIEKRMSPDRRSVMKITLRMQTPEKDEKIQITSDKPTLNWMGYTFKYTGGWRDEVRLKLIKSDVGDG